MKTTARTNRAVVAYRKLILKRRAIEDSEEVLRGLMQELTSEEFVDYHRMTSEIDKAADVGNDLNTAAFRAAVNGAGRDDLS